MSTPPDYTPGTLARLDTLGDYLHNSDAPPAVRAALNAVRLELERLLNDAEGLWEQAMGDDL